MKILVISDSHNVILDSQIEVIKKYGNYDMLIHCGDKYKDAERFANKLNINTVVQVPGNCDYASDKPNMIINFIEGKKLLITHGHLHNVKSGLEELIIHAKEENVNAVIYGHTHCAQNEVIDDILFFNPGSSIYSKCGDESFGIIEVLDNKIKGNIIVLN